MRPLTALPICLLLASLAPAATKYSGPRPPKADVPYLMHADNLLETEAGVAKTEQRKDATIAIIDGAASPAKTPLAEPIFIIKTQKLLVDKFGAYKLTSKDGRREVVIDHKNKKNVPPQIHLTITKLDDNLYRVEVDEPLENGEYSLSPDGSDDTFSFAIY